MCQAIHFEEKATAPRNDLNRVNVVVNHGLRKTSPWNSKKKRGGTPENDFESIERFHKV